MICDPKQYVQCLQPGSGSTTWAWQMTGRVGEAVTGRVRGCAASKTSCIFLLTEFAGHYWPARSEGTTSRPQRSLRLCQHGPRPTAIHCVSHTAVITAPSRTRSGSREVDKCVARRKCSRHGSKLSYSRAWSCSCLIAFKCCGRRRCERSAARAASGLQGFVLSSDGTRRAAHTPTTSSCASSGTRSYCQCPLAAGNWHEQSAAAGCRCRR